MFELTRFHGLGNYLTILTSPMMQQALGATLVFAFPLLILTLGLGFALALLYTAYQLSIVVWMLYGYFRSLPIELEHAAMIDGCSRMRNLAQDRAVALRPRLGGRSPRRRRCRSCR